MKKQVEAEDIKKESKKQIKVTATQKSTNILYLVVFLALTFTSTFLPVVHAQQEKAASLYKESVKLFDEGNIDRALELIKESINADPNYSDAHTHLGYVLLKKGQPDEAIDAFNSALKLNSRMRASKTGLGLALLKKGDLKSAESVLKDALILNPYPSMTHYALGLVYEKLNDYEKAIHHFKKGIKLYKVRIGKE